MIKTVLITDINHHGYCWNIDGQISPWLQLTNWLTDITMFTIDQVTHIYHHRYCWHIDWWIYHHGYCRHVEWQISPWLLLTYWLIDITMVIADILTHRYHHGYNWYISHIVVTWMFVQCAVCMCVRGTVGDSCLASTCMWTVSRSVSVNTLVAILYHW